MSIGIVVSRADRASEHIGEQLLAQGDWTEHEDEGRPDAAGGGTYYRDGPFELRSFDELHIHLDDPVPVFSEEPRLLVFVSRHAGETGALLTGHFTGNFGEAEYGGEDGDLAEAAPSALSAYVSALGAHAPDGYDVAIEGTHHGPTALDTPSMFAELGSGEEQWEDPEGARAVAQAVLSLRGVDAHRDRQLVGVGGGHYAPRFFRVLQETPWAVGHIASDWQLSELGHPRSNEARAVLETAFERSGATHALLDGDHPELARTIEELGYRVVSETWVRTVGDRPLALVDALESGVATVDEGLRFGAHVPEDPEAWELVSLPDDLLAAAQNVDGEGTRAAVAGATVAFDTIENGTRARGEAAVPDGERYEELVDELAAILRAAYDEVRIADDAVIAREQAFDPEKAQKLGVPEGPKMGQLSGGEAVEVGDEEIPPSAVLSEREERFPV
ncbi:D-tyrosyl-tRNA(Tyr) deacylase [Halolamina pelagica]|uniref:D-aminoacyl-tRNA deacylase n=1 Tax=Halolamina pelagica TaxID=699431 RepID=A0A0P7I1U5_9EURY|nr:D-aminoacyl-tRNA deacylase [Halolamina pelagica]KPN30737.1 D-tyrosyl-tRNA(Tyr) deacylase [Halolamina pelagica]